MKNQSKYKVLSHALVEEASYYKCVNYIFKAPLNRGMRMTTTTTTMMMMIMKISMTGETMAIPKVITLATFMRIVVRAAMMDPTGIR